MTVCRLLNWKNQPPQNADRKFELVILLVRGKGLRGQMKEAHLGSLAE